MYRVLPQLVYNNICMCVVYNAFILLYTIIRITRYTNRGWQQLVVWHSCVFVGISIENHIYCCTRRRKQNIRYYSPPSSALPGEKKKNESHNIIKYASGL